jgi:hypothetical protein
MTQSAMKLWAACAAAVLVQPTEAGGGQLFSEGLNLKMSALMMIFILIFTLIWEEFTQWLEHALSEQEHYSEMLTKIYRELVIVGIISMAVVLSNEFSLIHDHDALIAFEFGHLLIFAVSMIYVVNTLVASNRLNVTAQLWTRIANAKVADLVEDLGKTNQDPKSGFLKLWVPLLPFVGETVYEDCEWKILRLLFLKEFKLGREFDYTKYTRKKLITQLGHSLHIHPSTWGLVMTFCFCYFIIKHISGSDGSVSSPLDEAAHRRILGDRADTGLACPGLNMTGAYESGTCAAFIATLESAWSSSVGNATYDETWSEERWSGTAESCTAIDPLHTDLYDCSFTAGDAASCSGANCKYTAVSAGTGRRALASAPPPPTPVWAAFEEADLICETHAEAAGVLEQNEAFLIVLAPIIFGWVLFSIQLIVVMAWKRAVHRLLEAFGCKSVADMPDFLHRLDAEVDMSNQLPHIPMFEECGTDFHEFLMEQLTLKFYEVGDDIFHEGDDGHSMIFICQGHVNICHKNDDGKDVVLGALGPGDYAGEMSILLDQPRSKTIKAHTKAAVFELDRAAVPLLDASYPQAVQSMVCFRAVQ